MRSWIAQSRLFSSGTRSANNRSGWQLAVALVLAVALLPIGGQTASAGNQAPAGNQVLVPIVHQSSARSVLALLKIKGRAPKTGYARSQFSDGWANISTCSTGGVVDARNYILNRDLSRKTYRSGPGCVVDTGTLHDPYTNRTIHFVKGIVTSLAVQIDHVVALSNAWQTGAANISSSQRFALFNDPNNLLAVDGPTNGAKSDSDAASWLPPNKAYRCKYVARQIFVKFKYHLWVTKAEHDAMARVLTSCPTQKLPSVQKTATFVYKG
ncbi:MAG: hypothetical protein RL196_218 [Actinomycetota bacterium]